MTPISLMQLPFSSTQGWKELSRRQPSVQLLVLCIVLPMSLIPPLMLYYAGTHYGDAFMSGFADKQWRFITTIFFLAELLTFAVMGWLIYEIANTSKNALSIHDAYMLAALAPIPMWLSALALWVPSLAFNIIVALIALGVSCSLVYHGLKGLAREQDEMETMSAAYTIMSASVLAWGLLIAVAWAY
ncbi:Yip1 family protein [Halomonas sp. M20]|uniref:Yip1 family protein n=1 Tax=Halomonas sp. M20 TaxID=2763264 RepID=UPI001D0A4ACF|nr:Yip1 family protein [Halomonas sp. M20]